MLSFLIGLILAVLFALFVRNCLFTVAPNERAVLTEFGKARRLPGSPESDNKLDVIQPGGPYWCWPWQKVHKVDMSIQLCDIAWDPTKPRQNAIDAVTKDNLSIAISGQLRWKVSEANLYAYMFGVRSPMEHVMGYFISILRERIANFSAPTREGETTAADEVSINALRKNLPALNLFMLEQCRESAKRYGIELDAALIQQIDPPGEVDEALAAISTTRNQVAADISGALAQADQEITRANRVVEITRNNVEAEVAPIRTLGKSLVDIAKSGGHAAVVEYVRNARLAVIRKASSNITRI